MKKKKLKKIIRAELSRIVKVIVEVTRSKQFPSMETIDKIIAENFKGDKYWFDGPPMTGKITNLDVTGLDKPKKTRKRRTA